MVVFQFSVCHYKATVFFFFFLSGRKKPWRFIFFWLWNCHSCVLRRRKNPPMYPQSFLPLQCLQFTGFWRTSSEGSLKPKLNLCCLTRFIAPSIGHWKVALSRRSGSKQTLTCSVASRVCSWILGGRSPGAVWGWWAIYTYSYTPSNEFMKWPGGVF